jgi:hypothetical protein
MVLCHLCHAKEHGRGTPRAMPIAGRSMVQITTDSRELKREQERVLAFALTERLERELKAFRDELSEPSQRGRMKDAIWHARALRYCFAPPVAP